MTRADFFLVNERDNVVTALRNVNHGIVTYIGCSEGEMVALDDVEFGHKMALKDIKKGESIIKYGVCIGTAIENIVAGAIVHIHNISSLSDKRSCGFSPDDASPQDMIYKLDD